MCHPSMLLLLHNMHACDASLHASGTEVIVIITVDNICLAILSGSGTCEASQAADRLDTEVALPINARVKHHLLCHVPVIVK